MLNLYEDGVITKVDLSKRLGILSEEKERLDKRIAPIEQQVKLDSPTEVNFAVLN